MYKKVNNIIGQEADVIIRLSDMASIPKNPANRDYQEYLKWTKASPMNIAAPPEEAEEVK